MNLSGVPIFFKVMYMMLSFILLHTFTKFTNITNETLLSSFLFYTIVLRENTTLAYSTFSIASNYMRYLFTSSSF